MSLTDDSGPKDIPSWIKPDTSLAEQIAHSPVDATVTPLAQTELASTSQSQNSAIDKIPLVKEVAPPYVVEELMDEVWPKKDE